MNPEADSEVLRLLSERREDLVAERTRALKAACTGSLAGPPARRGGRQALCRAGRTHRMRGMRSQGCASDRLRRRLASEVLRDVRTLNRKITELNTHVEAEVYASGTSLT